MCGARLYCRALAHATSEISCSKCFPGVCFRLTKTEMQLVRLFIVAMFDRQVPTSSRRCVYLQPTCRRGARLLHQINSSLSKEFCETIERTAWQLVRDDSQMNDTHPNQPHMNQTLRPGIFFDSLSAPTNHYNVLQGSTGVVHVNSTGDQTTQRKKKSSLTYPKLLSVAEMNCSAYTSYRNTLPCKFKATPTRERHARNTRQVFCSSSKNSAGSC